MAIYVDFTSGNDGNSGADWANAKKTIPPGAGVVYCKNTFSQTTGDLTWNVGGTPTLPTLIYGVKSGTTATPPTDSDVPTTKETFPLISIINDDIRFTGSFIMHNVALRAGDNIDLVTDAATYNEFRNYWLRWGEDGGSKFLNIGGLAAHWGVVRIIGGVLERETANNTNSLDLGEGTHLMLEGVTFANPADFTDGIFEAERRCFAEIYGCDLSAMSTSDDLILQNGGVAYCTLRAEGCRIPDGVAIQSSDTDAYPEGASTILGCNDETGITAAIPDAVTSMQAGTVENVTTPYVDASDGDNNLAIKMTPSVSSKVIRGARGLRTASIPVWVDGDGSTAFTLTIEIMRDDASSAPLALDDNQAWLAVRGPGEGGTAVAYIADTRPAVLASTSALATSSATWTGGQAQKRKQKIGHTFTPDHPGYVVCQVHYAPQDGTTRPLYVSPKIDVSS